MAPYNHDVADAMLLEPMVVRCHQRVTERLDDPRIDATLRTTLVDYWSRVAASHEDRRRDGAAATRRPAALSTMAGMFLLVMSSEGSAIDDDAILEAAAGCELYRIAVTLFDAIEDDELEPPVSTLGNAVATNAALVIFVQGCDAIMALGERLDPAARTRLRQTLHARSLLSGLGQHRDLSCYRPPDVEAAARQAEAKTATVPMTAELAAIAAGCDEARTALYGQLARRSALLRQCGNDLEDLFGKARSDDLAAGKWSLPLVAFWHHADADARAQLVQLRRWLPDSTEEIRALLFGSGALHRVAEVMEAARREIHDTVDALGRRDTPIELIARLADVTTARLYARKAA